MRSGGMDDEALPSVGAATKKIKVGGDAFVPSGSKQHSAVTYSEADSSSTNTGNERLLENAYSNGLLSGENGHSAAVPALHFNDAEASTSQSVDDGPLKSILDSVEAQYVDERTTQQMKEIEKEINENVPLISEREPLDVLLNEYADDKIYVTKIMDLKTKYNALRRTRGDGNCFYRSLGFSIYENFMRAGDMPKVEAFQKFMAECYEAIVTELGYDSMTMGDFADQFNEQLSRIMATPTDEELLRIFQDQGSSDFIVVWLRFLTVLQLRREPDFYENFIENHANVQDFCRAEVEPMYKESDHIHIIAVASLLKMKIRVEYVDRGDSPTVISHEFPESEGAPEVFLLYRPGHYDVLYPLAPSA